MDITGIKCDECQNRLFRRKDVWHNDEDCYWCESCKKIFCFPYFRDDFGKCAKIQQLYREALSDLYLNEFATIFIPVTTSEYKAIPLHARWNRKFIKHSKNCPACKHKVAQPARQ